MWPKWTCVVVRLSTSTLLSYIPLSSSVLGVLLPCLPGWFFSLVLGCSDSFVIFFSEVFLFVILVLTVSKSSSDVVAVLSDYWSLFCWKLSGTVEESVKTGGDPSLSSSLGIIFIIGLVTIDLPSYHRDRYMSGDIPSFCLARVMRLVRLHSLSIVSAVVCGRACMFVYHDH